VRRRPGKHEIDVAAQPLLMTLGLGVFAGALDLGVLSPALPAIGSDFAVGTGELAWIFTLYLLVNVIGIAVMSSLADRYGRRSTYIACLTIFGLGSILAMAAPNYAVFLLARAIQAFGAGGIFPVATAAIGDAIPPQRRGAALGLVAATWGVAAIVGPTFGGIVTHFIAWRWIFAPNIPLVIAVLWLAGRHLRQHVALVRERLDVIGLVLLAAGMLGLTYGAIEINPLALAVGIGTLVGFAFWERNTPHPIMPPSLLRNAQLGKTYALELLIGVLEGSLFFVPTVLVGAQHLSTASAGIVAALGALMFVIIIPLSGRALDTIGSRDVLLGGALLTEIGLALFALGFDALWTAIAAIIVAGVGFGALLGAPTRYIVSNETGGRGRATAIGLLSQFLILGQVIGASIAGGIMGAALSDVQAYRNTYLTFAVIAFAAIILAAMLRPRAQEFAVRAAESRYPDVQYDVISVLKDTGDASLGQGHATDVLRAIMRDHVPATRIHLGLRTDPALAASQVRVYVR